MKSIDHELETLPLPGCHVSYIITYILPETHLEEIRRKSYDGETIYTPHVMLFRILDVTHDSDWKN